MRIQFLTDEQIARFAEYRDRWTAIGLSTQPANRKKAELAIHEIYRIAGLPQPDKIVWCGSPLSQGITRAIVGDSVRASVGDSVRASVWASVGDSVRASVRASVRDSVGASVRDSVGASVRDSVGASVRDSVAESSYGQHDASWLAFYDYFREVCGLTEQTDKLTGLTEYSKHAGWSLPHANICWCAERHNILTRDGRGRLHCGSGPALAYPDGWAIYAWHGVRVPEKVIIDRAKTTVKDILAEPNTEVRRVMRNLYGNERFMRDAGAQQTDESREHGARLFAIQLPGDPVAIKMLELTCPSTGNKYMERVPPDVDSALEALSWRFNVKPAEYRPQWET